MMNREPAASQCDRREWLRASARYAVLGGVAVATGYLVVGRDRTWCGKNMACGECGVLLTCSLPDAVVARDKTAAKAARYAAQTPIPNP
jgi:hypothetical protein